MDAAVNKWQSKDKIVFIKNANPKPVERSILSNNNNDKWINVQYINMNCTVGLVTLHQLSQSKQMLNIFRKMLWKINPHWPKYQSSSLAFIANDFRWDFNLDKA